MAKVKILLDTPGLPVLDIREYSASPRVGEFIVLAAHQSNTAYKIGEIYYDSQLQDAEMIAILQADTGKNRPQNIVQNTNSNISEEWRKVFEHATNYNNVMMLAGYAGLFAIWSLIKDKISTQHAGIVAVLTGIALIVFVLHEVAGMWGAGLAIRSKIDPSAVGGRVGQSLLNLREKLWIVTFPISVILGFSAAGILLWRACVDMLFK